MKTRIITAAIFAAVCIPILLLSEYIVFPIALAIFSLISVMELLRVFGLHRSYLVAAPSYGLALLLPFFAYKDFSGWFVGIFGSEPAFAYLTFSSTLMFLFLLYMAFASVFARGKLEVKDISIGFMSVVYIVIAFVSCVVLRYMDYGFYLIILVVIIAWGNDISAYFVGTIFGKHKLIPEVSPKKTVEGAIGGVILAAGLSALFAFIVTLFDKSVKVNYLSLVIMALVLAVISILGDLFASTIKRQYGVKDFGTVLPGHGGMIDRFDSIIAISTLTVFICMAFPPFVAV
ncbi:MAG: phosphatidate cytidylyltransferase [Clostridia bacterium]|nr:phosphatidate cytidylyltransferase [Clostridia bacterium]